MNDDSNHLSDERLKLALEGTNAGLWDTRLDTGETYYSPDWRRLLGYGMDEELDAKFWQTAIHPDDLPHVFAKSEAHFRGEQPYFEVESRMRKKSGEYFWALHRGKVIERDSTGKHTRVIGIMIDISSMKETEQKLCESETNFRAITENSLAGVFIIQDRKLVYVNPATASMLGYTEEVATQLDRLLDIVIHPDDRDFMYGNIKRRLAGEDIPSRYPSRLIHKDGHIVPVEIMARAIEWHGKPAILGSLVDLSEILRNEEERQRLMMAIEQSSEEIMITDVEGRILYVNPAFEQITGYTREEVLGKNPRFLKGGKQEQEYYKKMWKVLKSGKVWQGEFTNIRKDGTPYEEKSTISPVRDGDGKILNYIAVKRDITHEKQLEEQLHQSQKMEAIGRLAGGVAHDFNNMLTVINGNTELISSKLHKKDPLQEWLMQIMEMVARGTNLTQQLLAFSRRQPQQPEVVNINTIVNSMTKMLRRLVSEDVEIRYHLEVNLPNIVADTSQLEQVIMNLVENSRDAMPNGGMITIETSRFECTDDSDEEVSQVPLGKYCVLTITDNGTGMAEEVKQRIFEPFFTTKPEGQGTGLGLSTVHGIVMQSGGWLSVTSEIGFGTTMKMLFPVVDGKLKERTNVQVEENIGGSETILLVEDEIALRAMTEKILSSYGYKILTASNGKEAQSVLGQFGKEVNLILTDVVMPYMGGPALVKKTLESYPAMKALYMSGYTTESSLGIIQDHVSPFLQKPFGTKDLLLAVRAALR